MNNTTKSNDLLNLEMLFSSEIKVLPTYRKQKPLNQEPVGIAKHFNM